MAAVISAESVLRAPAPPLRPLVRSYVGYRLEGFAPGTHLGLPSRHLTVVISLGDPVLLTELPDPHQAPGAWRALASGLATQRAVISHDGNQYGVQLDLTPAGARVLLGVPAGVLGPTVVDLEELLGPPGRMLPERMAELRTWSERFAVLDKVLAGRAGRVDDGGVAGELRGAWSLIVRSGGAARVRDVAEDVGWSRRHLSERFNAEFGLSPKVFASLVRFERSRRLLQATGERTIADVAADCGYADQAHLSREWHRFAGCPPTRWLASEEFPSVQDEAPVLKHS